MIDRLRTTIAEYIIKYSNAEDWEEIKFLYSVYTYTSFLVIALKNAGKLKREVDQSAVEMGIELKENIEYLFSVNGVRELSEEVRGLLSSQCTEDTNTLYQEFLSVDYVVRDKKVMFEGGKNSRDTLGAYYTQEDFAVEITRKAVKEYIDGCACVPKTIRIADFSCGGGVFLAAAQSYCKQMKIGVKLFGVDVDPVAVMITRARLHSTGDLGDTEIEIMLGNPLLKARKLVGGQSAFITALKGRFYNPGLGIDVEDTYDIEIGNPPWEKIRFEEKKFLAHYVPWNRIDTKKSREQLIELSSEKNKAFYLELAGDYEYAKAEIKGSSDFKETKGGELNTYALFTEYALKRSAENGIIALIVKSSLLKMPVYSAFMSSNVDSKKLYEIYMFVNRNKIFNIDSREEFSVVFFKNNNREDLKIAVDIDDYRRFYEKEKIILPKSILKLINPETGMIPNIKNNDELNFLRRIYSNNPTFDEAYGDSRFGRLVHLTNHSQYIVKRECPGYLPVYEGKFIELYTGKYATFRGMEETKKYKNKAAARLIDNISGDEYPEARFYIKSDIWKDISKNFQGRYIVAWRSLTSATNRRTMLATILPLIPACQSVQLLQIADEEKMLQVLALFNSIIFDYIVRLKMAGLDLTQTIIRQIPVPGEESFNRIMKFKGKKAALKKHIISRIKALYRDDVRVRPLFEGVECYEIEAKSRKYLIAELDYLAGMLYGLEGPEIKRIAASFDKYYSREEVERWF